MMLVFYMPRKFSSQNLSHPLMQDLSAEEGECAPASIASPDLTIPKV
jgi:hypothetical protein